MQTKKMNKIVRSMLDFIKYHAVLSLACALSILLIGAGCSSTAKKHVLSNLPNIKPGTPEFEWIGDYNHSNGRYGTSLSLRSDQSFSFETGQDVKGAKGIQNKGTFRVENGALLLSPDSPIKAPEDWTRLYTKYLAVKWGSRHYLVPDDDKAVIAFCNEINEGYEPRKGFGWPYLRIGEEKRIVTGKPELPVKWNSYLLKKPIICLVKSVNGKEGTVSAGSKQGLKVGMNLFDMYRQEHWRYEVKSVDIESAVFIDSVRPFDNPINLGAKLSTLLPDQ